MRILLLAFGLFSAGAFAQTMQPAFAITNDASSVTITAAAYVQLSAATTASCTYLSLYNSTAKTIYLAVGAASSESRINYDIPPSASAVHSVHLPLRKGVRLSARAVGADATTGTLTVNCLQ